MRCTSDAQLHRFVDFYVENLREPLFVGLLTVAAFMFSLKTFIIVTMKEGVYATDSYEAMWKEHKKNNPQLKRYQGLQNFALLLFLSVLIVLIAAIFQLTVGLFDHPIAAVTSVAMAVWALAMIFVSLIFLQMNLRSWFQFLDR